MVYKVTGKISELESNALAQKLNELLNENEDVLLDMEELQYISSAGLRVLIMYFKQFRAKGYNLGIINCNDAIKHIFVMTGLDSLFINDNNYTVDMKK